MALGVGVWLKSQSGEPHKSPWELNTLTDGDALPAWLHGVDPFCGEAFHIQTPGPKEQEARAQEPLNTQETSAKARLQKPQSQPVSPADTSTEDRTQNQSGFHQRWHRDSDRAVSGTSYCSNQS